MYNLVAHKFTMYDIFRDVRAREEKKLKNMREMYLPVFP